jgi:3-hydroxyisobutyrate dehydrogenase-like beta-hydroxyacid dehydrogenase
MAERSAGFVGVGRMGGRLAGRLIHAGYDLTVYDSSEAALKTFADMGAHPAGSPAEVASSCEIVMTCLPTPAVVHAVALGAGGIVEGKRVKTFIDMSTTGATYAKRIAEGLAAKGIVSVDAPVSGGVVGAERGTLAVMVSCPEDTLPSIKDILEVFGKIYVVGNMGVKAGLDAKQIMEVINAGTGRNSATADKIPRCVIPRTFNTGFAIELLNKDVKLCLEEADVLGIPMVVGTAVRQLLAITMASEGPAADMTETVKPLERWAGVKVE